MLQQIQRNKRNCNDEEREENKKKEAKARQQCEEKATILPLESSSSPVAESKGLGKETNKEKGRKKLPREGLRKKAT